MKNVGLARGTLELLEYREDYDEIYEKEKQELLRKYKDKIKQIDHIGSTSIKSIKSKPIIDILIQTDDLMDYKKFTEANIEGKIYTIKKEPTLSGGYLIRKEEDGKVKAFLHVYETGDINAVAAIKFRDYMRRHPSEAQQYEKLKLTLYSIYKNDRKKYTAEKDKYIRAIITKAMSRE